MDVLLTPRQAGPRLRAQGGPDRAGGGTRRPVRRADIGPGRAPGHVRHRRDVQAPVRGRARLPGSQGRRPRRPAALLLAGGPGPGAPLRVLPSGLRALAPRGRLGIPALPRRGTARADRSGRPPARSPGAIAKERDHWTPDGLRVGSFRTLMAELATLTRNRVVPAGTDERAAFEIPSEPTPLQARAFELIGVSLASV
jgi:hypothetical protein